MKKIIILLFSIWPALLNAQNVAINNDGSLPDQTALLDIKSSTKGILIPRLTTLERTSIAGPALGLTVFDKETVSFWMYRGDIMGGWAELQHSYQKYWDASGSNIYTINAGNIGMGTNNPAEKLCINAANPAIQFLNANAAKGYLQANGNDMRLGTYVNNTNGNLVFNTKAVDRMWIDETGKVGIGTSTPTSALTVNGTNPWLEMQNAGVDKGFLQASGNDLRLGTNSTNTTGNLVFQTKLINRMLIDENGQVGIGTTTPSSVLTINGTNPIVQFRNGEVDKGFVQLLNDDIKIGTNITNTTGKFIVRTKGVDRFTINDDGYGVFGSSTSDGLITMNGPNQSGINFLNANLVQGSITATSSALDIHRDNPGYIRIRTGSDGMWFKPSGQISVGGGGQSATGYVLSIEGKAIAAEFRVLAPGSWPDYVFSNNYSLKPLAEIKKYIKENNHLPNIPAASEIEKNGIPLGEMSKNLMEKVEELTLYIIDLQEQVDLLKKNK